jgi:hypothetical protein
MNLRDQPHYSIASSELAAWLESQGTERWWNVDGDPLLTGRLSFPSPADELATELRRLDRMLLVQDPNKNPAAQGQPITARELDALVTRLGDNVETKGARPPWVNDRLFFLCWKDRGEEWLLVEDEETSARSLEDAAIAQTARK